MTGSWRDHRSPASALSLKGARDCERPRARLGGFSLPSASPAAGSPQPCCLGRGDRAMRRDDGCSAHLKRSRPEFEVFWRLSATHTRRFHSSRDSGPRSGCSRSCSQRAGGGGGGGGRGFQTRAIAPAPAHFPFGSSRRRRLPVNPAFIGRPPGDVTPGARGVEGGALKGP